MIWLLDAGNTQVKVAVFDAGHAPSRSDTVPYAKFAGWARSLSGADRVVVSCVAANTHREHLEECLAERAHWVRTPAEGLGIRCAYEDHRKWGVDRWLALAAVQHCAPKGQGSAVVDIGTATTFDICNARGEHLGGWIAPGPVALLEALGSGRTSLPRAASDLPAWLGLATDTEQALTHGALHCAVGCLRAALAQASAEGISQLFLSGGGVNVLAPYLSDDGTQIQHDLVLHGLWLYAKSLGPLTEPN